MDSVSSFSNADVIVMKVILPKIISTAMASMFGKMSANIMRENGEIL